jgi:hypothetical protein
MHDVRMVFKSPAPKGEDLRSVVDKAKLKRLLP